MMEIEVDVDWVTTGMKVVVDSLVSVAEQQWNMKLIGIELILRGRMLFVMHLSKTVLPGISGANLTDLSDCLLLLLKAGKHYHTLM
jgi:hypothetical protein